MNEATPRRGSAGLNKVMLIGNLGADPEMRYTSTGSALTTFRIGVSRYFKGQDGTNREETEWCSIVSWGPLAETLGANLTKGRRVYVEGRLATRSWDGQDGQKRYRTEIVANEVIFLDRPSGARDSGLGDYVGGDMEPEDLPFDRSRDD